MLLFVYGSLLRGEDNHHVMRGARLVGAARTAARYTLVDLGPYPAMVGGGATAVAGELYDVPDDLLAALDAFEGHPDEYVRSAVDLAGAPPGLDPARPLRAEAYLLPAPRAAGFPPVASGDWRARRSF